MRYDNGKPIDKRKRLYYPYCGYKPGFCLLTTLCPHVYPNGNGCKYYRHQHPIAKCPPQSLVMEGA